MYKQDLRTPHQKDSIAIVMQMHNGSIAEQIKQRIIDATGSQRSREQSELNFYRVY